MKKTLDGGVTLNHRELFCIADALRDILKYEIEAKYQDGDGIWLNKTWLTPETCYHIANLLESQDDNITKHYKEEINMLRKGQNIK